PLAAGPPRRGPIGRQPRPIPAGAVGARHRRPRREDLRGAGPDPPQPAGADPSRPDVLRPPRQRRFRPGDDRPRDARPAARGLVLPSRLEFAGSAPGPRSARAMRASRGRSEFRIWGLALGYFGSYIPYSGLTKGLTQGSLPGTGGPTTGFTILPGTVVSTTVL